MRHCSNLVRFKLEIELILYNEGTTSSPSLNYPLSHLILCFSQSILTSNIICKHLPHIQRLHLKGTCNECINHILLFIEFDFYAKKTVSTFLVLKIKNVFSLVFVIEVYQKIQMWKILESLWSHPERKKRKHFLSSVNRRER